MRICVVDSSTAVASVALMEEDKLVFEANMNHGLTHSEKLMPLIDQAFTLSDWQPREVDVFGVVEGPGSFTGLRIGVATVKGLAQAADKPVVGVGTLDVLAMNAPHFVGAVVPILDARRGEVYTATFHFNGCELVREGEDRAVPLCDVLKELLQRGQKALFLGDGVPVHREAISRELGEAALFMPPSLSLQRASSAAVLVMEKARAGLTQSPLSLTPRYVRASNAQKAAWRK